MPEHPNKSGHFNQKWHDYYTEKRIVHQWMQVHLLKDLPVRRILEIGPYLGLVTAMLRNAGYQTTILDLADAPIFPSPDVPRIAGDIRDLDGGALATGEFDAILCCETLEHLPYGDVDGVLARLAATGVPYLVLSVPYMGSQLTVRLYANRYGAHKYTSLKKFMGFKRFRPPPADAGWEAHKWEVGYRDMPLGKFRALVERHYRISRTEFTAECRSVFFLCRNRAPRLAIPSEP